MIKRYVIGSTYDPGIKENDNGLFVQYTDHLKEVESLKIDKEIFESVKKDHKLIKEIISSTKPKWIPGPPTTTGLYILKMQDKHDCGHFWNHVMFIDRIENGLLINDCHPEINVKISSVFKHCPIQEPVDE